MNKKSISQVILIVLVIVVALVSSVYNIEIFNPLKKITRKWYISGEFSSVVQPDGTTLNAQNAAAFNSQGDGSWENVSGVNASLPINGKVSKIYVDSCRNTYIGGLFTEVNCQKISYLAKYDIVDSTWKPISSKISFVGTPTIKDISVDCFNKPSSGGCKCDVYVVGKFEVKFDNGPSVYSFFKYDANDEKLDSLSSDFGVNTDIIGVHKREFDLNFLSSSDDQVWIAGVMNGITKLRVWDRNRNFFGQTNPGWSDVAPTSTGSIRAFHYHQVSRGSDMIYFGGENLSYSDKCQAVCAIKRTDKSVQSVGKKDFRLPLDSKIYDIFRDGSNNIYAGGDLTQKVAGTDIKYLSKCKGGGDDCEWAEITLKQTTVITKPVVSLTVCLDPICDGTIFYAMEDGRIAFSKPDETFLSYDKAVNGNVTNVFTIITNSSTKMVYSSLMLMFSVVMTLFFLF